FMLGGVLSGQYGHLNQVSATLWLPWALLPMDRALRAKSLAWSIRWLTVLSVCLGLQVLAGHPQQTYMTLVCAGWQAAWRLWGAPLRTWIAGGAALGASIALGMGLAAAQLLPTLELARESIRSGGLEYREAIAGSLWPWLMARAVMPSFVNDLGSTEFLAYVGIVPLLLALIAASFVRRRGLALAAGLALGGLFLALGGANPLYPVLHAAVPGFSSFRVPSRWALVYTLGIVGMAALRWHELRERSCRWQVTRRAVGVVLGVVLVGGGLYVGGARATRELQAAWAGLALGGGLLAAAVARAAVIGRRMPAPSLVGRRSAMGSWRRRLLPAATAALLLLAAVELWLAGGDLAPRRPVPIDAYAPVRDSTLFLQARTGEARTLSVADEAYELKEAPDLREWFAGLGQDVVTETIVALKRHEVLTPNLSLLYRLEDVDGYDGGLLPTRRYFQLASALLPEDQARPDGVLVSRLHGVPGRAWLDLFGIRTVLTGRNEDFVEDGLIRYDRALTRDVPLGESLTVRRVPARGYTILGLISSVAGGSAGAGSTVGCVAVEADAGACQPLVLGRDTGRAETPTAESEGLSRTDLGSTSGSRRYEYFARVRLPDTPVEALTIRNQSDGALIVRAATLIDDRDGATTSLVLDDGMDRTEFFDMNVYEVRDAAPLAYLASEVGTGTDDEVLALLRRQATGRTQAVVAPGLAVPPGVAAGAGTVAYGARAAELHTIRVNSPTEALLVEREPFYPGWRAFVDGREVPVQRVNVAFRGVVVPAGAHEVQFQFDPGSFRLGVWVSVASLGVLLALGFAGAWWGRARVETGLGVVAARRGASDDRGER
ncbi:MAG: YfhO family protein, partial [Chloroflexi bacterium]|nr:YfhO family protein [Chloroflexota bacterium]